MNKHYVYKITNINPTDSRKYYIGVRTAKRCAPEADTAYWGSCKSLNAHIKEIGQNNFTKVILKTFQTRPEAVSYEIELHDEYEVATNQEFYNRSKQKTNGFDRAGVKDTEAEIERKRAQGKRLMKERPELFENFRNNKGENNPFSGKTHSEDSRKKIGQASRKRKASKETKKKLSKLALGKNNPRAYIVKIYDSEGVLQEKHEGTFHSLNGRKGYPYMAFIKSYKNNGEKIYQTKQGASRAKHFGLEKYIGWYAIKEGKSIKN